MRIKVWITNGDLGSENNWAFEYAIVTPQGIAKVRYWCNQMQIKTGKTTWAEYRSPYGTQYDRVVYRQQSK